MTRLNRILVAACVGLGMASVAIAASTGSDRSSDRARPELAAAAHSMGWGGHHRGHRRHGEKMLKMLDVDGDGRLTQSEVETARVDALRRFDADGDGKLSLAEYQGLWLEMMRERMVDAFQMLDEDGDALVTGEEFSQPMRDLVLRMDENGDGELTREEMRRHGRHGGHHRRHGQKEPARLQL